MISADNINKNIRKLKLRASAGLDKRVHDDISKALGEAKEMKPSHAQPNILRIVLTSQIARVAMAAVLIIVVFVGISNFFGSVPAFAEVIQPLLTARTAAFKMTFDTEGSPLEIFDCMVMESGLTREVRPGGVIRILDQNQNRTIMLYPAEKKAVIFEKADRSQEQQKQTNWLQETREWIRLAQETEDESVEYLGKHQIDGVEAFGYRIRLGEVSKMTNRTVWADADTLLPIRIEYSIGSGSSMGVKGTIAYSSFIFNIEMDESLFSVPEGYDVKTIALDVSETTEEDLIQALCIWSEHTNGEFPSELNIGAAGQLFEAVKEKMGFEFEESEAPDFVNPKFPEFYTIRQSVIRGLGFKSKLTSESDWHYAGEDIKFGDSEKPICWYRPEDSETYRVIYGDLSVKDILPEDLSK
jgi:hypothetical protein